MDIQNVSQVSNHTQNQNKQVKMNTKYIFHLFATDQKYLKQVQTGRNR